MIRTRTTTALALAATLAAGTALAQTGNTNGTSATTPAPGSARTTPGAIGDGVSPTLGAATPSGARSDTPSSRNPVLTDHDTVRASKVIGSSVYNDKDEKIGSIDDVILDKDHKAIAAVISVGGFLGLGAKLIEVPYQQLQFGDTRENSDNRVKLPGATKDSLQGMPEFSYRG